VVQTTDAHPDLKVFRDIIAVSFESGEQTTLKIYCQQACQITGFEAQVTKTLAATDSGTVQLIDNTGTTQATITFPAGSTQTTEGIQNPTAFNIPANSFYRVTWAKTTAGGKATVQVTGFRNGNG
jgi:hypothetical protein